jgi:hypothetical protein
VKISTNDFEASFNDVIPAFGMNRQQFQDCLPHFGFLEFNASYQEALKSGKNMIQQFFQSPLLRLTGLLVMVYLMHSFYLFVCLLFVSLLVC